MDGATAFQVEGPVAASPEDVVSYVREAELSGLAGELARYEVLRESDAPPYARVVAYATRLPWPFRARAFVVEQTFSREGDAIVVDSRSVAAPWAGAPQGCVPGRVVYSGYRVESRGARTLLRRIIAADLDAFIPGLRSALQRHYARDHERFGAELPTEAAHALAERRAAWAGRALFDELRR